MDELKAAIGKEKITPPVGIPLFSHLSPDRICEGVHDDLWARVLVLQQGDLQIALVSMDLAWPLPENDYLKVREAIQQATPLQAENIMVSCTHNHQGPAFDPHRVYDMPIVKQQQIIYPWVQFLINRIVEAAKKALTDLKPARVSFAKTLITGLCYNREKQIPDGITPLVNVNNNTHGRFYFGDTPDMPDCIRQQYVHWGMPPEQAYERIPLGLPNGPIDPDLSVVHITDEQDKSIAIIANYGCHPVCCSPPVPRLISAGFPGVMAELLREETGGECIFTFGAGGDIRPYRSSGKGFEEAQRVGFVLATGVMEAIRNAKQVENPAIKITSGTVPVPLREYPPREEALKMVEQKRKAFEQACSEGRYRDAMKLENEIAMLEYPLKMCGSWVGRKGWMERKGTAPLEVQVIAIGDIILLSLPNEVNVSIGLEIKQASWTDKLLLLTLTNGEWMYLVKKEEFEQGRYEAIGSMLAPGAAEKIIETANQLIQETKE